METIFATTPEDIARNFKNLIRKKLVTEIHQNQNKLEYQNCYLVLGTIMVIGTIT